MADEHRMAFYNNRPRRCDFGTYGLRRDGPVPYQCFLPSFFDKPAPKSNSPCLATFTRQRVARSLCGSTILKNRSDRACRVVHSSPCRMFHASLCTIQSRNFCGDFNFLVTGYLLCMEMTSSCLKLSSFSLRLDTNYYIIVTDYSSWVQK